MLFIVRAHEPRRANVDYLSHRIRDLVEVWDTTERGWWWTMLDALRFTDGPAVHLEDDVLLTRDFEAKVDAALEGHEHEVVQLFSQLDGESRYSQGWIMRGGFVGAQCFYLPAGYGPMIATFVGDHDIRQQHPHGPDLAVGAFLEARSESYWIHSPSLVQHDVLPSGVFPTRRFAKPRTSPTFVDPDVEQLAMMHTLNEIARARA